MRKPRDEKGRVLYTSDESSGDELNYVSDSDGDNTQQVYILDINLGNLLVVVY